LVVTTPLPLSVLWLQMKSDITVMFASPVSVPAVKVSLFTVIAAPEARVMLLVEDRSSITTSSVAAGTLLVLQLLAVSQSPPAGLIQVTVEGVTRSSKASSRGRKRAGAARREREANSRLPNSEDIPMVASPGRSGLRYDRQHPPGAQTERPAILAW
jgi:hypothetical protein